MKQTPPAKDKRTLIWRRRTTYSIWSNMLLRCYDERHHAYWDYGGRGITVYEEWRPLLPPNPPPFRTRLEAFANFVNYMGLRPSQYVSLDRYPDVDGPYAPGNLRWGTKKQQSRNKRATILVPDPGDPLRFIPAAELAERLGLTYQTLRYRMQMRNEWPGDVNPPPTTTNQEEQTDDTDEQE